MLGDVLIRGRAVRYDLLYKLKTAGLILILGLIYTTIDADAAELMPDYEEGTVSEDQALYGYDIAPVRALEERPASDRFITAEEKGSEEEALLMLPKTWKATLQDGTETKIPVTWECVDDFYDDGYTSYVFEGSIGEDTAYDLTDEDIAKILTMEIYFKDQVKYFADGEYTDDYPDGTELPMLASVLSPHTITGEIEDEQVSSESDEEFTENYGDSADVQYGSNIVLSDSTYDTFKNISAKTSNYSYKKLSSAEKSFYNRIDKLVDQYLYYGKSCMTLQDQPLTPFIPVGSLSYSEAADVYVVYYLNNPQAFFLTTCFLTGVKDGKACVALCFLPDADTPSEIQSVADEIAKKMNTMASSVKKASGQYNMAKKAQKLICKKVTYDYDAVTEAGSSLYWRDWTEGNAYYEQSLMSFFKGNYNMTICAGYSQAYMAVMRLSGMEASSISGTGHQWNKVKVYGNWYCVDNTWDDDDSSEGCSYKYFLKSDSYMNSHQGLGGHFWYDFWYGKAPESGKNYSSSLNRYTVKYVLGGGLNNSANPKSYKQDTSSFTLKSATRKGYVFKGWYTDARLKNRIKKIQGKDKKDYTLYAKWSPISYKIVFNKNGGKGSMKTLTARRYGKKYTLSANKFSRKGYTFVGWTTRKDGKGKVYKDKASVKNLTTKNGGTVTLYAKWKKL